MLQTGMGAHPQLLSSLYVSSKAWPSSLMSLLMTSWSRASAECLSPGCSSRWRGSSREPVELPGPALADLGGFGLHSLSSLRWALKDTVSSFVGTLCEFSAVVPALAELCRFEGAQDGCLLPLLCSCGLASNSQSWGCAGSDHTFLSHQVAARDLFLPSGRFSCSTLS